MAVRTLLIDTDTASDDAVALIMALRCAYVRVYAITVVAGNVPLAQAVANAVYTCDLCQRAPQVTAPGGADGPISAASIGAEPSFSTPIFAGAARPLLREASHADWFHGKDGLGNMNYPAPPPERSALRDPEQGGEHAVDAIVRIVSENPGIELVTLGPLTNIAMAISRAPHIVKNIARCTVMGGNPCCVGNVTPAAEYNIWCDPEAATIVFKSGLNIDLVGWQLCRGEANLNASDIEQIRAIDTELAHFAIDCNRVAMEANRKQSGEIGIALPDPVAMAVALAPREIILEASRHRVEVECHSELTRGMTIVDQLNVGDDDRNRGLWSNPAATGHADEATRGINVIWKIDIAKWKELLFASLR